MLAFLMDNLPDSVKRNSGLVQVGDVYPAKGGRGSTRFFVIVSIQGNFAHCLGIDTYGQVVSTTSYGTHVFEDRKLLGRVLDFDLTFNIEWEI